MSKIRANLMRVMVVAVVVFMAAVNGHSAVIFYESFEDPLVGGRVIGTLPTGWVKNTELGIGNVGLNNAAVTGKTGNQFAFVQRFGGRLQTTSTVLANPLEASVRYDLSFDVSFINDTKGYSVVELLAGTNVMSSTTNYLTNVNNLSTKSVTMTFLALPDNPYLGQTLGIRLGTFYDILHNQDVIWDNIALSATATTDDVTPPTPNNMVWSGLPTSSVSNSITMQATNAVDVNGVQYFFTNTVNGNVSGWQDSPIWSDTGLTPGVTYSYKVKARDKSANTNETNWSSVESAACEEHIILYESFENPSILPNTTLIFTTYPLPPAGWGGSVGVTCFIYHDSNATFPDTPFGEQYAVVRPDGVQNFLGTNLNGRVLEAGYTYRVTYNAGGMNGDGTPAGDRYARATLMAGTNTVATSAILPTSNNLSETNTLEFIPDAAHPDLGEVLKLKLDGYPDFHQDKVMFDNIKVYAIPPPPSGTVIMIQ